MDLYFKLIKQPVFNINDVFKYYSNKNTAKSALRKLINKEMVVKIKNGMYTCISGETGLPVATRYQIAAKITSDSYISHHTAMEYYGYTDQVYYEVYVSSKTRFRSFQFNGYFYKWIKSRYDDGVEEVQYSGGVRVTNIERTVIDCINDMNLISGLEEVVSNINSIHSLNEYKLMDYLNIYQKTVLYQKVGFILSENNRFNISSKFYEECKSHIGNSKCYLTNDHTISTLDKTWNVMVPRNYSKMQNGE
ncbi:MAG: hypothetical protein PHH04_00300 [Thomasclavelia sp.]|nr:hypothetical protein [Thomasclavelia sp.]